MLRVTFRPLQQATLSKATRLELGNVKSPYGELQTAAGSHEKWGFIFRGLRYPIFSYCALLGWSATVMLTIGTYMQYRDMMILSEHVCYEDLKDRCLSPMPGWARLRTIQTAQVGQFMTYRDPTPLEWLPFELKLGQVKQASI